ncbi:MAG: circularly permuted type 2 ATP-grasp protein [Candidatus Kapaibacteriota bacterium]
MLLNTYTAQTPTSDEMWTSAPFHSAPRANWQPLIEGLNRLGNEELRRRTSEIQRLLRENGVTYSVYNDPNGLHRAWQLDPVPLIVGEHDWRMIESGLQQRVELLNLVLSDLYGERRLITQGLLPLELIYTHSGFLRPCSGVSFPTYEAKSRQLRVYGADMARGPDNRMWVLSDRTQAPSGAGYALENRLVMNRALPDAFAGMTAAGLTVRRIVPFFSALQESLLAIVPERSRNPHIVVLTPGPGNETHFEHAYLASSLGYTLVQGEDLTVRDGFVWLRSLGGLQRVDVILRRVDDSFCDPLELRSDSHLGVAGLLEVVRRGNVAIANPLGSGILENPALMAFLPGIARYFLGEDLILPSAATWWCGQERERRYVLENLSTLIIKPIDRSRSQHGVYGQNLSTLELERLRGNIEREPHRYVGQEFVHFSTAPVLRNNALEPRYAVLRTFLVALNDGYIVMPGGLTRAAADKHTFLVSNQAGGTSKDTWVLASEPEPMPLRVKKPTTNDTPNDEEQLGNAEQPFIRHEYTLSSRTAENLFWVGRYAERAQNTARLLRTILQQRAELVPQGFAQGISEGSSRTDTTFLHTLLYALTQVTMTYPGFVGEEGEENLRKPEAELIAVALDVERIGGLASTLLSFKRSVYAVRERLSGDTWRVMGDLERSWNDLQNVATQHSVSDESRLLLLQRALDGVIASLAAFLGLNMESMGYDEGWFLLDAGRRLERVVQVSSLLRSLFVFQQETAVEQLLLTQTLELNECLMTYRSRYRSQLHIATVLDLLLIDRTNPRSVAYQLERLQRRVEDLPRKRSLQAFSRLAPHERSVLEAQTALRLADVLNLVQADEESLRTRLEALLSDLSNLVGEVSSAITQEFFNHAE